MRIRLAASLCLSLALPLGAAPAALAADDLDAYAKAVDERPEDASAYEAYAAAAFAKGRIDDALQRTKLGVARVPDFARGYYLLAYGYRRKSSWADAATFYRAYIALRPKETDSYFGLAKALEGLGDKKGAVAAYRKYVAGAKAQKASLPADRQAGVQKYIDDANAEIARLEPPAAPEVTASQLRAEADRLRGEKKFDEAAAAYKRAIAADKSNVELYNLLGNAFYSAGKYNDAAAAFRDAVGKDPSLADGWYNLAHALGKADKKQEAVEAYRRYIKLKPDDPDPYYGLAKTLKQLDDGPGAIAAYKKYIEMEKRPAEQKWVEKARAELAGLEKASASAPSASTRIDEK